MTAPAWVGPFVVPAARVDELLAVLGDGPLPVSVIAGPDALPAAVQVVQQDSRTVLTAVEVPPPVDAGAARRVCAVDVLAAGGTQEDAVHALARTSGPDIAAEVAGWSPERASRAHRWFTSFGTCSVGEPVEHLRSLGPLPSPGRIPA